ncbi:hypothetical protein EON65_36115 [archaeon]|nr:MAG: hypothetical protein EON65_36115 [archaeon]
MSPKEDRAANASTAPQTLETKAHGISFFSHFQRIGDDAIQALHEELTRFLLFLDGVLTRLFCQLAIWKAISMQNPILLL